MVHLVTRDNRSLYRAELAAMQRDRHRTLGLDQRASIQCQLQADPFDTEDVVYLLALETATRRYLGSVRLLPSLSPDIHGLRLPELYDQNVPVGDDIWEIERISTASDLPKRDLARVHLNLSVALVEYGLLCGISHYTCVASLKWLPKILSVGWECEPLGLPRDIAGEMVAALRIRVSPATLQIFLMQNRSLLPMLQVKRGTRPITAADLNWMVYPRR